MEVSSSSSNTYSTAAYSSSGMSGLISGLDTEGMVKSMLDPIQTKIDKQNALKQQLTWKQESYRDVIDKVNEFQTKYFSFTSDTCLKSTSLFNNMKYESSSSAVEIIGNSVNKEFEATVQVARIASASTLQSSKLSGEIKINSEDISVSDGDTIDITLDGIKKTFTLSTSDTMETLKSDIQKAFGSSISLTESDGNWSITAGIGQEVKLSGSGLQSLGFDESKTAVSTSVGLNTTLKDYLGEQSDYSFTINGKMIELTGDDTISSLIDKISQSDCGFELSYSSISDKLKLESNNTGAGFDLNISDDNGVFAGLFKNVQSQGGSSYTFDSSTTDSAFSAGQNAVVCIDGTVMERTTNTFSYNDYTLKIKDVTGDYIDEDGQITINNDGTIKNLSGTENKAQLKSVRDTDEIVDVVKSFVDDYNTLIEELNSLIHEESTYKQYDPLTDDQKSEMSDKEIELWEEKARSGLLRNDSSISNMLTQMRKAMYEKVDDNLVLSQIGIDSSSNWKDYGKLSVDEDTLRAAIEDNPKGVQELFTGTDGLAARLDEICSAAANKSSSSKGTIVQEAGVVGYASETDNYIYNQLQRINERIQTLSELYDKRKESYWDKFNAMEVQLEQISSQSSWLSSFSS